MALTGDALAARNEMDEFTETWTPRLIGECEQAKGIENWCMVHDKFWPSQMTCCLYRRDMEGFADALLQAWEGRQENKTEQDPSTTNTPQGERHE